MRRHTLNIRRKKFAQQRNPQPRTKAPQVTNASPTINLIPLSRLILDERNANVGTARGRKMLEESIRTLGIGRSVLVDRRGRIIAGNKTIDMARKLGMRNIAVVQSHGDTLVAVQRADLVDGYEQSTRWSAHKTDIYEAVRQGCLDRFGNPLRIDELRVGCLDEEMWQQEYGCQFLSIASQWISPELFEANVSTDATAGYLSDTHKNLYVGWDVARNRDLSVIWLMELVADVSWTRGVIEMRNIPTPDQIAEMRRWMPMIRRLVIDKSSMGLAIFEQLSREIGGKVEGVQFTLATKEALAVSLKRRMEETKLRIPDTVMIRNSFRSVKKSVTPTGQARFDAAHDERFGHADHFWAACKAESAVSVRTIGFAEFNRNMPQTRPRKRIFHTA